MKKNKDYKMLKNELKDISEIHRITYTIGLERAMKEALDRFNGDLNDEKNVKEVMRIYGSIVADEATTQYGMAKEGMKGM